MIAIISISIISIHNDNNDNDNDSDDNNIGACGLGGHARACSRDRNSGNRQPLGTT